MNTLKISGTDLYKQILEDTNQLIQISNYPDFTMVYANRPARSFTGHESRPYQGEKCYRYMMGSEEQCPFCPMRYMEEHLEIQEFETEIDNGNQVFAVKTKRLTWEGQEFFIEYATDITMMKRAQAEFENQMRRLLQSIPEAQGIFHLNLTENQWISSNGISANIDKLQDIPDVDMTVRNIAEYIPNEEEKEAFLSHFLRDSMIQAYAQDQEQIIQELHSWYEDGSIRWTRMTARLFHNPSTNNLECILYGMDINEEKVYQEQFFAAQKEKKRILEMAKRDFLTGIYGRQAFEAYVSEYIGSAGNESFAILFMDLDYFKDVNDLLGHMEGDRVLKDVANKLQTAFSNKDIVARFGGDEFCVLVKDISKEKLEDKISFLLKKLHCSYGDGQKTVTISASIGAVFEQNTGKDVATLIREADNAMYHAKQNGKARYCFYDDTRQ